MDSVSPLCRATSNGGWPAPTILPAPLRGSSATHIAVMKERAPRMLRKSRSTARMISVGVSFSALA